MPRTTHTPEGAYPQHRPVHHIDLDAKADELCEQLPGHARRTESLAREAGVSVLMIAMEGGDTIEEHSAAGVVIAQLMRGHVSLSTEEGRVELYPGEMTLFQPGVRHDIRAEEQSVVLLTVTGGEGDG